VDQRLGENRLRWIADAYDVGFTLTLSEGLSPYELLRAVGARDARIVPLTRSAAEMLLTGWGDPDFPDWEDEAAVARLTSGGFLPTPPTAIVRAGSVAGWAYALEEHSCHTGTYLATLSERGRAFCVHRNAKGFSQVGYALDGQVVTFFEPGLPHLTSGAPPEEALGFVHQGDELGDVAFLEFLGVELGMYLSWEETEAELPSAAFA
jgi:hypothetical protein